MISRLLYHALLEMRRCRVARWAHSRAAEAFFHGGWEPEVVETILRGNWQGPVWDVGANVGKIAHHIADKFDVICFEPGLNSLYYLGWNTRSLPRVTVVPCALTLDGAPMRVSCDPNFFIEPNGPKAMTISVDEAIAKFGQPGLVKIDIEGGEYEMLKAPALRRVPLLIEWHRGIPEDLPHWTIEPVDDQHSDRKSVV